MPTFYEFFAGGGMARLGLGDNWQCLFANDISEKKAKAYEDNFGKEEILCEDIHRLNTQQLPGKPDLIWGSFPCQDLSLAGNGEGLSGKRSGTFNRLIDIICLLKAEERDPSLVVIENVIGTLSTHNGKDFRTIVGKFINIDYSVGAVIVDAIHFVPQSRPRFFLIAIKNKYANQIHQNKTFKPDSTWHPPRLIKAYETLSDEAKEKWIWWDMPIPAPRQTELIDIIEENQTDVEYFSAERVEKLINMMSETNLLKLSSAKSQGEKIAGGLYKRIRVNKYGERSQRAEVRFDGNAGCLRTPTGGSSKQTLVIVEGDEVKARYLSRRETARLMGVPDNYILPQLNNEAYYLFGDGLAVPAVRWIETHILRGVYENYISVSPESRIKSA